MFLLKLIRPTGRPVPPYFTDAAKGLTITGCQLKAADLKGPGIIGVDGEAVPFEKLLRSRGKALKFQKHISFRRAVQARRPHCFKRR